MLCRLESPSLPGLGRMARGPGVEAGRLLRVPGDSGWTKTGDWGQLWTEANFSDDSEEGVVCREGPGPLLSI